MFVCTCSYLYTSIQIHIHCMFYNLEKADAEGIFTVIDQNFSDSGPICYSNLVGMGSDGCNVMLGSRNSDV